MALYMADQLEEGGLDYLALFSIPRWFKFKAEVDAMLIADGRQDLIVEIPVV